MKTNEFMTAATDLGFKAYSHDGHIIIADGSDHTLAVVDIAQPFQWKTHRGFNFLDMDDQQGLYDLLDEYARTPVEERERQQYLLKADGCFVCDLHLIQVGTGRATIDLSYSMDSKNAKRFSRNDLDALNDTLGFRIDSLYFKEVTN